MKRSKLTARACAALPPGKHDDGDGLRLYVSTTGGRKWVYRYSVAGRRREMGLGSYPAVGLAEARVKCAALRALVLSGTDPLEARSLQQAGPTFRAFADDYIAEHTQTWSNAQHAKQWQATLATYAYPVIGNSPLRDITTADVLAILRPIWANRTATAKRVAGRIERVLDAAAAQGLCDRNNPARWRGHLDAILPSPGRIARVSHFPAMPWADLPAFWQALEQQPPGVMVAAMRWIILTACRTSEALGAQWDEIDGDLWTIPAARMKARREHRVPLSGAAMAVLDSLYVVEGCPLLFPSERINQQIRTPVMSRRIHTIPGCESYTVHGFRSSFRDWAGEAGSYPHDVIESALAHAIQNKTVAAYARSDLLARRRVMMEDWAAFVTGRAFG